MGVRETEIYADGRSLEEDALDTANQMLVEGHTMSGLACVADCAKCGPYRRTPEVEVDELIALVQAKMRSTPPSSGDQIKLVYHVNRTRLQTLSRHPGVETSTKGSLVLSVRAWIRYHVETPEGVSEGVAEVLVRGLLPIAGKAGA